MSSVAIPSTEVPAPVMSPRTHRAADFADWLSPILVKELRQGLKTRAFITVFILIQVGMVLFTGLQLLEVSRDGSHRSSDMDGVLAFILMFALLILMPGRGIAAVSEEVKANTLDLVQLTRLTAFRIVFGKWVALVAQTLLLVTAVLPYAVLRYFFGDVNIIQDLAAIGILILISMVLTAGALALSSAHVAVRIFMVLVLFFGMMFIMVETMNRFGIRGLGVPGVGWWLFIWSAVLHIYLLLEIAASRIAPASENHSGPKRAVVLIMLLTAIGLMGVSEEVGAGIWTAMCLPAAAWVIIEALSERTVQVPSLYSGFVRFGWIGRMAGRVFYPGWASGMCFVFLLMSLVFGMILLITSDMPDKAQAGALHLGSIMLPIISTAVVFPLLVILMFPRMKQPFWLYLLTQALCILMYAITSIVAHGPRAHQEEVYRWLAPFPTSVWLVIGEYGLKSSVTAFFIKVTLPICAVIVGYLVFRAFREFSQISRLEARSQGEPDAPSNLAA